jgi:hypothetical protein
VVVSTNIVAWTVSYPFDIIKSWHQAAHGHTYKSIWDGTIKWFCVEDWQVSTLTFLPCTLCAIPISAFTDSIYALLKQPFDTSTNDYNDNKSIKSKNISKTKLTTIIKRISPQSHNPIWPMWSCQIWRKYSFVI